MPTDTQSPSAARLITSKAACAVLRVTYPTLHRYRRRPDFPRPIQYSPKSALLWDESELIAWQLRQRVAAPGGDHVA
jgi:predicted DNA-binding transcriptional regulator AlpA